MIVTITIVVMWFQFWFSKLDFDSLMYSVWMMESGGAYKAPARYEPSFYEKYHDKGMMPRLIKDFGQRRACSSYGPMQIMLVVAWENGFKITPYELSKMENNWVIAKVILTKYCDRYGWNTGALPKIYKRWNGASSYMDGAWEHYLKCVHHNLYVPYD